MPSTQQSRGHKIKLRKPLRINVVHWATRRQQRLGKYLSVLRPMFLCVCSRFVSDDKRNEMKSKVVCLISLSNVTLPVHMSMEVRAPGQKVENSSVCSSFSAKMPPSSDCYTAACATCTLTNTSDFLLWLLWPVMLHHEQVSMETFMGRIFVPHS